MVDPLQVNIVYFNNAPTSDVIRDSSGRCWKITGAIARAELPPGTEIVDMNQFKITENVACCEECEWTQEGELVIIQDINSSSSSSSSSFSSSSSSSSSGTDYYKYYGYYGVQSCPITCIDTQQAVPITYIEAEQACLLSCQITYGTLCIPSTYVSVYIPDESKVICHCCHN